MRARIHRGAHEIGGSCVEIEHDGKRIVLDVGRPLDSGLDTEPPLPAVPGLASGDDPALLGVLVSHAHPDHYRLVAGADPSIAIYIGEGAQRVLAQAAFFTGSTARRPARISARVGCKHREFERSGAGLPRDGRSFFKRNMSRLAPSSAARTRAAMKAARAATTAAGGPSRQEQDRRRRSNLGESGSGTRCRVHAKAAACGLRRAVSRTARA